MLGGEIGGDARGLGEESGGLRLAAFLAAFGPLATLAGWGALGREEHAALCGLPRFLRPWAARNACGKGRWGVRGMPRFAACRVSCGLWAARNACGVGRWGVRGMPRFAACRVSCGLRAARNACAVRGGVRGAWGGLPRFATCRVSCGLWAARNACGVGRWGVGGMPRFAACRVSCGLWAARNACAYCAAAQGFGALPQTPAGG